ncbi:hypothetical protein IMSAGC019_02983 [Lachnospiraceae bacterium]|nr:hypothetical protein IMSAGC019_02983 [Lachnospiraceae bacterium]
MARGKKSYTLEEQLERITSEIEEMEVSLKELKKEKKDLEEQVKMNRLAELDEMISSSGKSFDEVKEFLANVQ